MSSNEPTSTPLLRANTCVALCSACCILLLAITAVHLFPSLAPSQPSSWGAQIPASIALSSTRTGVGSLTANFHASSEREQRILSFLAQPDNSSWAGWTLGDLEAYLSEQIPVFVAITELQLQGIDMQTPLDSTYLPDSSIGTRLQLVLEPLELTFELRPECLALTTRDATELSQLVRIYDVAPIVRWRPTGGLPTLDDEYQNSYASLLEVLTKCIHTNDWIESGGTNSLTPLVTQQRALLVVLAPTRTQLEVAALLDILNRSQGNPLRHFGMVQNAMAELQAPPAKIQSYSSGCGFPLTP
ncbi:hypothetical protein [Aureliella helgolandensis]|uniref:Uncharacterized protein n=1 Tax=Aureliella helgolandensis TaxID=2527968 RepID=A0A518G324_9BACT|nr:hypothetical protein [Aureliella helgolandensis]QDV22965.1 hypothetical protein Q31a_12580 [Aureliella helgolandensis]